MRRLRWKFSPTKRGLVLRQSSSEMSSAEQISAGEEAVTQRRVGHEADAEFAQQRQQFSLDVARPQRVLRLKRGDRVHGVGASDRVDRTSVVHSAKSCAGRRGGTRRCRSSTWRWESHQRVTAFSGRSPSTGDLRDGPERAHLDSAGPPRTKSSATSATVRNRSIPPNLSPSPSLRNRSRTCECASTA